MRDAKRLCGVREDKAEGSGRGRMGTMKPFMSLSMPMLGKSGIMCATTLNPQSLAS